MLKKVAGITAVALLTAGVLAGRPHGTGSGIFSAAPPDIEYVHTLASKLPVPTDEFSHWESPVLKRARNE